jgi:hypothetical protein
VTAKRAANVSPDAVKQNAHPLLVALTEELLTSGLRHVVDLLKVDLLLIDTLDIKRSSVSLIKTMMEN